MSEITAPLRRVRLPRYDDTLTLERSAMFSKYPFVVMGELHGVRYPARFFRTREEADRFLDWVEEEA